MCYHYSLKATKRELEKQYSLIMTSEVTNLLPVIHVSAFNKPLMPVITSKGFECFHWGLIPHWARSLDQDFSTYNAKIEGIEEKPTWQRPIASQRCLVPATGFYEWRHEGKNKYPYHIQVEGQALFSFGGIWDQWVNPNNQETYHSFSILTMPANEVMRKIHNTKMRMPLIINPMHETVWTNPDTPMEQVYRMLENKDNRLQGYTLQQNFLTLPDEKKLSAWQYPELGLLDLF